MINTCRTKRTFSYKFKLEVVMPISRIYIFNKSTDDFFRSFTEREKLTVLRARRLIRVLRIRLLRSMRRVKILPVRFFSFGNSLL